MIWNSHSKQAYLTLLLNQYWINICKFFLGIITAIEIFRLIKLLREIQHTACNPQRNIELQFWTHSQVLRKQIAHISVELKLYLVLLVNVK